MNERDLPGIVELEQAEACFAVEPNVVLAYLFGSVARGEADSSSDVDVAVLLDRGLTAQERLDAQLRLMGALSGTSTREVEVVLLNEATPLLAYRVAEEGIPLYVRDAADHASFMSLARRVYFDWRPWEEFHTRALLQDIKEVGLSGRGQHRSRALEGARRVHQRLAGATRCHSGGVSRE